MGNSEQGCICGRNREKSKSKANWKELYQEEFEFLYRQGFKWAEGICAILMFWDYKFDNYFQSKTRWQTYLGKNYKQSIKDTLFKNLGQDFFDITNPIGAIIIQFSKSYSNIHYEEVHEKIISHDKDAALHSLHRIKSEINSVVEVIIKAVLNYYICLSDILNENINKLKELIISKILSGELYRLVYDLAFTVQKPFYKSILTLGLETGLEADPEIIRYLIEISISESPHDKLLQLFSLKHIFFSKQITIDPDKYIWNSIINSNVKDIFAHLTIIDFFTVEPMESSVNYFVDSLNRIL